MFIHLRPFRFSISNLQSLFALDIKTEQQLCASDYISVSLLVSFLTQLRSQSQNQNSMEEKL